MILVYLNLLDSHSFGHAQNGCMTPLVFAASKGYTGYVRLLLEDGAFKVAARNSVRFIFKNTSILQFHSDCECHP